MSDYTTHTPDPADLHSLTAGYALDALDEHERALLETHLPSCRPCQEEVREMHAVAAMLTEVSESAPPPQLRAAVLAAISATPQLPALAVQASAPLATVTDLAGRRRNRLTATVLSAAAVLAVIAVGLGVQNNALRGDRDELQAGQAQTQAALAEVRSVLTAGDARTVSADIANGGQGAVVFSPAQRRAVFVGTDLTPAPAGRTYQLWLIDPAGQATSAGLFRPGADGSATTVLAGKPSGITTIGLSIEPAGGSAAPTTEPVLAVPLTA